MGSADLQNLWAFPKVSLLLLTLIWMAWGIYDSLNFEQKQLNMAWSKNSFYSMSIPYKMCQKYILLKVFI
jgi:hypothetical protein